MLVNFNKRRLNNQVLRGCLNGINTFTFNLDRKCYWVKRCRNKTAHFKLYVDIKRTMFIMTST